MKILLLPLPLKICGALFFLVHYQMSFSQDKLFTILDEEVQREMHVLAQQEIPVYYMNYRVDEIYSYFISSSFGALTRSLDSNSHNSKVSYLTVTVRVGSPTLDNYHSSKTNESNYSWGYLPSSDEPLAVKQVLWNTTNKAYQQAVARFSKIKADVSVKVAREDTAADFITECPNVYFEPQLEPKNLASDIRIWEDRLNKYSAAFLKDSAIFTGSSYLSYTITRKYFVSNSGDKIVQNNSSAYVNISGKIKAQDGMEMPLYESYFAHTPEGLPSDELMTADANTLVSNLTALKTAPVAESYSGPALLTGKAAGVFFHEIFGHRVEGQRMKNEDDGQTFKKKVNEQVLPASFNVYCDPQKKTYADQALSGFYVYDDQGSKGERVNIVHNGFLKDFLMSRTPINGFFKSNGHGRAMIGMQPVARQSNLIVETTKPKTLGELRAKLIQLVKEQHKPYGYLFDEVLGGFTMTGRYIPNAFNVTPILVYRVYSDGRPDEIVRGVDLIGTPLSMFSQIDLAGGKSEIFNGYCGAESGSIPVSCAAPMVLIKVIETQKKTKSQERQIILPRPDHK
jgi:predicted Zn-dependent protease